MQNLLKFLSIFSLTLIASLFFITPTIEAQETEQIEAKLPEINFFYSETCPHCAKEEKFLEKLQKKYPDLKINSYEMTENGTFDQLLAFAEQYNVDQDYLGLVPMTFVGDKFFVGFDNEEGIGAKIETVILEAAGPDYVPPEFSEKDFNENNGATTIAGVDISQYSLPALAIVLGFLDGFNVCSLGALLLILSLVLTLKSRKKALLFGLIFLIITGFTYALLIVFWSALFGLLNPYIKFLEILIALLGIGGAIYFFNQYVKFKKYGPTCETISSPIIKRAIDFLKKAFADSKNVWTAIVAVIAFAFVVTIIEFPCSAVVPVAFAAILTNAGVSSVAYGFYLTMFMAFYLLDEIIVLTIGVWTMKLWMSSPKMTIRFALIQSLVFLGLGIFYLSRLL